MCFIQFLLKINIEKKKNDVKKQNGVFLIKAGIFIKNKMTYQLFAWVVVEPQRFY